MGGYSTQGVKGFEMPPPAAATELLSWHYLPHLDGTETVRRDMYPGVSRNIETLPLSLCDKSLFAAVICWASIFRAIMHYVCTVSFWMHAHIGEEREREREGQSCALRVRSK